jgi:hypothetical protein
MINGYMIFHLNLAFSSIPTIARPDVIQNCYWPLLNLVEETGIPVGIELTGWTLHQIKEIDSAWVDRFKSMLGNKQCELIGSGWSQLIGPLVPYEVNRWNQKLGLEAYSKTLGVTPKIVLVNEMAFSTGMVDVYAEAGYQGIVMDRDNVRLALGLDHSPISRSPTHAKGSENVSIPVLWADSILFQRLQRAVHGDSPISEYMDYVQKRVESDETMIPIYTNDVEIFDYRPGRFTAESRLHPEGEWARLKNICNMLESDIGLSWMSPSQALDMSASLPNPDIKKLTSVSQPVPVKKQAKYNINRWAVTGRNDLWLNTSCHHIHQSFVKNEVDAKNSWQTLCELWASDLRTHITEERWKEVVKGISKLKELFNHNEIENNKIDIQQRLRQLDEINSLKGIEIDCDEEDIYWTIKTPNVHLVLNARRGLTIKSLAFKSHNFEPIIGTLPQGYFSSIELGADFYSGGVVIEMPGERIRITDLEWVTPTIQMIDSELIISAEIPINDRVIRKKIIIDTKSEQVRFSYDFPEWERPLGIVRVGFITLLPEWYTSSININCNNGGKNSEIFQLDNITNHGRAASTLVSSTAAFGATDGVITIKNSSGNGVSLDWNPADCAAMPMLQHQLSQEHYLTRLLFSLCELDDTSRAGGVLKLFSFNINAI